jgi:tetratricopeptide (TPR) repeat protein
MILRRIRELVQRKKSGSLKGEFLEQIKKNPQDTRSRLKLGDLHAKLGEIPEAVDQYTACAEIFAQAGFHLKSIALYRQVLKLDPNSVQALRRIGQLCLQYGLYADAYPYYQSLAERLRPREGGERIFALFQEISNLPIRDLRYKALMFEALFPDPSGIFTEPTARLSEIARSMAQDDKLEGDALLLARWLVSVYPASPEGYEILAGLLKKSGDRAQLAQTLTKLREIYALKGELEKKEKFLREFEPGEEEASPAPDVLGERAPQKTRARPGEVRVKMEADVYELLRKKTEDQKPKAEGRERAAGGTPQPAGQGERIKFEDLFSSFKEGIREQVSRGDFETHYNLGIAYQEMGLYEDAIQEFELACGDPALAADARFLMGKCSAELEQWPEALGYYENALALAGEDSEKCRGIRYEMALTLRALGRDEEALNTFRQIREESDNYRDTEKQIEEILKASNS